MTRRYASPCLIDQPQGFALVTVLLLVALISLLAINYVQRYQLTQITAGYSAQHAQLQQYIWSIENRVLHALSESDEPDQHWRRLELIIEQSIAATDATVDISLNSAEGRFNVNNLLATPLQESPWWDTFARLLDNSSALSAKKIQQLQHYIEQQYRYGARPEKGWVTWQDLFLAAGLELPESNSWQTMMVALPSVRPVNLNQANTVLLQAMLPGLSASAVQALVRQRNNKAFMDTNDFLRALEHVGYQISTQQVQQLAALVGTQSQYFQLDLNIIYGHIDRQVTVILQRQKDRVSVIKRRAKKLSKKTALKMLQN